jgi:hypothetical protein
MSYKVREAYDKQLKRDFGTGKTGNGKAYQTRDAAEKRATVLKRHFTHCVVKVVRSN